MPTKLKNLVITKVALVDEGSCSAAHIKLYKRKEEGGNPQMGLEEILKSLPEDQQQVINSEIAKAKAELPEGAMSAEDAKKLEEEKAAAEMAKQAAMDEANNLKKSKEQDEEEILKGLDPAVRAIIEKSKAQTAAAEAAIKKMKDEQDTLEAINKAKELPNLAAEESKLSTVFKSLKGLDENIYKEVFGILKAADALIKDNALAEIGKSASGTEGAVGDSVAAWNAIEKAAESIAKTRNISKEQAVSVVMQEDNTLYQNYLNSLE